NLPPVLRVFLIEPPLVSESALSGKPLPGDPLPHPRGSARPISPKIPFRAPSSRRGHHGRKVAGRLGLEQIVDPRVAAGKHSEIEGSRKDAVGWVRRAATCRPTVRSCITAPPRSPAAGRWN